MRVAGPAATVSRLLLWAQAVAGEPHPIDGVWQQQGFHRHLLETAENGDAAIEVVLAMEKHIGSETERH